MGAAEDAGLAAEEAAVADDAVDAVAGDVVEVVDVDAAAADGFAAPGILRPCSFGLT